VFNTPTLLRPHAGHGLEISILKQAPQHFQKNKGFWLKVNKQLGRFQDL